MLSRVETPGPIWGAFALVREQVERLVAVNLLWSVQLLPGVAGLALQGWPLPLRMLLVGYSALAAPPATLVVYALVRGVCEGEEVKGEDVVDAFRTLTLPSFRSLAPLLVTLGGLGWAAAVVSGQLLLLDVLLRLALLFGFVCALFWGPLLVDAPRLSPWGLLARSVRLVLRAPGRALGTFSVSLLAVAVMVVSVGGLFLLAFVLLALFGTLRYLEVSQGVGQDVGQ